MRVCAKSTHSVAYIHNNRRASYCIDSPNALLVQRCAFYVTFKSSISPLPSLSSIPWLFRTLSFPSLPCVCVCVYDAYISNNHTNTHIIYYHSFSPYLYISVAVITAFLCFRFSLAFILLARVVVLLLFLFIFFSLSRCVSLSLLSGLVRFFFASSYCEFVFMCVRLFVLRSATDLANRQQLILSVEHLI